MLNRNGKYRHVVFADALNLSGGRPINFAPLSAAIAPSSELHCEPDVVRLGDEEHAFTRWVLSRAGVDVNSYRPETMARRFPACLRAVRANSMAQARNLIERNNALLQPAISALLIGVTSFFRDAPVFAALEKLVLPRLARRPTIRIWSAGCADGAEAYSVAMLMAQRGALERCHMLGTDARLEATRRAAAGRYHVSALREVPAAMLDQYFTREASGGDDQHYLVRPILRKIPQWRTADVLRVQEPGPWDMILCRNMAMYMNSDAAARLWQLLESALRPGGYLVLGKAERPHGATKLSPLASCIFRRERA